VGPPLAANDRRQRGLPARPGPAPRAQFPEIPSRQFDTAVALIETDGLVYSGAEAVFRTWAHNPNRQWSLRCHEKSPMLANLAEWAYRLVAENRTVFSRLTRWFGKHKQVGPEH
jgi:predicted DCC family thiol-disulfide oxidoreductase YuxK